ncbi:type II toxin-antitoxin system RelE/ParE family toxin [Piscinibacter sp.]|uniref:type II toxin-antitoxin system RelE/ParE family toxin n=1 Tax=Piscinibacter sp. TaxID=1903157 RepID=UPI002BE8D12A|nr:type II toxin-antitoxin system RelE/ParE family toxin [Albitalea sp.]HUG22949.1 type II toxin-antitoxin system RelE/ParE family toxin [Albitalea sp.]
MDELFGLAAARLADFPRLGKPGQIAGTRELIAHENYRLIYEVDQQRPTPRLRVLPSETIHPPPLQGHLLRLGRSLASALPAAELR